LRRRIEVALVVLAASIAAVAVFWPLFSATYPPITDLPFHAAQTSAFRHWLDDDFHFRDQFQLRPLAVPYLTSYVLGAIFMLAFSTTTAVKLATGAMLLLLPAGLGTLAWGMRKSPLLGLYGVPFAWCHLTHWGFINFVGALGLLAMALGLALRAVDAPSRRTQLALAGVLVVLFFTHVFRYPFAVAGVLGAALVTYPVHRRVRPVLWPLAPSLMLFTAFWFLRPTELTGSLGPLEIHGERWAELVPAVVDGFTDPAEMQAFRRQAWMVAAAGLPTLVLWVLRLRTETRDSQRFALLATAVPLGCALVFLVLFLSLPMEIGSWWYVYPREATAALFIAMGAMPDAPEGLLARVSLAGALAITTLGISGVTAKNYAAFDETTRDFDAAIADLPRAPRLCYLVFDHEGSTRTTTPYIHLPAWVQADRGGWLSFHFSVMGASPLVYREDAGAVVPPPVPPRWEWTPQKFEVRKNGAFFDWFLVRRDKDPKRLFAADPAIVLASRHGDWWLYRREERATTP
jgi:hypothetical protein